MRIRTIAVLLNGPPGIGKDTLADGLMEIDSSIKKMEYKRGLRVATAKRYFVDQEIADFLFAHRRLKDRESRLFGCSPRAALIETDTYLKNKHGHSMVGKWAAKAVALEIQNGHKYFVFSDSGFLPEAEMVALEVDFLVVVNLLHKDFNFNGDSRNYIKMNGINSCTVQFHRTDEQIDLDVKRLNGLISDALWENRNT